MNKLTTFFVLLLLVGCGYIYYLSQVPLDQKYLVQDERILSGSSETTSFGRWISDVFQLDMNSWSSLQAHLVGPFAQYSAPLEILSSDLEIEFWKITRFDISFAYDPDLDENSSTKQIVEAAKRIVFPYLTRARAEFHTQKTHETAEGIVLEWELSIAWRTKKSYILTQVTRWENDVLSISFEFVIDKRDRGLYDLEGYLNNYILIEGTILATR